MDWSDDAARNREHWDRTADEYHELNAAFIAPGLAWGVWQIPEAELDILGDVAGKDVLELGCGEAEWSRALARLGARPVGLDISPRRLERAREALARDGLEFPLLESAAERVPLPDQTFDVVFCDHGAMSFADPFEVVPEVARLLRSGGIFAFCAFGPLGWVTIDKAKDAWTATLQRDWFGLHRVEGFGDAVHFTLPHGDWIALFRANALEIDRLVELRPPAGATSTYVTAEETELARRFPMEQIWVVRKA
jgi:SAM-dependent methyltransferase